jgi:hypothetical protein
MRWQQGRPLVDGMLARGELERVPPSRQHADVLLAQAYQHVKSAEAVMPADPTGAYQLLYDAARKALCGVLENQGLRPTSRGGHIAVIDALTAQLDPPLGGVLRPFDRMRRRRNEAEYPSQDRPRITVDEASRDLAKVNQIVEMASQVLDQMSPY